MAVIILDECAMGCEVMPNSNDEIFHIIFEDRNIMGLRVIVPMSKESLTQFAQFLSQKSSGLIIAQPGQVPQEGNNNGEG